MAAKRSYAQRMKEANEKRQEQFKTSSFVDYLNIPDGIEKLYLDFKEGEDYKDLEFDILSYIVEEDTHPESPAGEEWCRRTFFTHRNIGEKKITVICPKSFGEEESCPICEYYDSEMDKVGHDVDELKGIKQNARDVFAVRFEDELHIFDQSVYQFGKILDEEANSEEFIPYMDNEEGFTLECQFDKNDFNKLCSVEFVERDDAIPAEMIEEIPDLGSILDRKTYEELEALFHGIEGEEPSKEEKKKNTSKKTTASKKKEKEEKKTATASKKKTSTASKKKTSTASKKKEEEAVEKTEEKKAPTKKSTPTKKGATKKKEKEVPPPECPLEGVVFGMEYDEYNECDDCSVKAECKKAKEAPAEKKKKKTTTTKKKDEKKVEKSEEGGDECPHGYTFGADCNEHGECDDCDLWDACVKKFDES